MISAVSEKEIRKGEEIYGHSLREGILNLIKEEHPGFNNESCLSIEELNHYRRQYMSMLVLEETGESDALEREVVEAIRTNSFLSENIEESLNEKLTAGQRFADGIAQFGGSWSFILTFFAFILFWMVINIILLTNKGFDPYPFILLNLILSCIAAIQAPVIMMSQNRKEEKDRMRSENDYKVNLKAELEIKLLNEKIDHMLAHQNKRLLEIQEIQADFLEDLMNEIKNKK